MSDNEIIIFKVEQIENGYILEYQNIVHDFKRVFCDDLEEVLQIIKERLS